MTDSEIPATSWVLPVELTDRVIDFLYESPLALRACALVHSSWLPAARRHLFHDIHIAKASSWDNLSRAVRASPELGSYVRSLYLSDWRNYLLDAALRDTTLGPALSRLEVLYVMNVQWLKPDMVAYLCTHFRTTSAVRLERIDLGSPKLIQKLVDSRPDLRFLSLRNVNIDPVDNEPSNFTVPKLEQLTLDGASLESLFAQSVSSRSHIVARHVRLDNIMNDLIVPMAGLLSRVGPSMETLAIRFHEILENDVTDSFRSHPLFMDNPNLKVLSLAMPSRLFARFASVLFPLISGLNASTIRTINIDIDCTFAVEGYESDTYQEEWDRLNALLQEPQFHSLERFSIIFRIASGWNPTGVDPMKGIRRIVNEQLASVRERGILAIEYTSTREFMHF